MTCLNENYPKDVQDFVRKTFRILEYISPGSNGTLSEAGEDPLDGGPVPPAGNGAPAPGGGDPMAGSPEGGDPMAGGPGGGDPMGGGPGGDDPMAGGPEGGDPMAGGPGGGDPMGGGGGVEGFDPQVPDQSMTDPSMDGGTGDEAQEGLGEDDELINVEDLTDSQENTEHKVIKLDNKISKLIKILSKIEDNIDANSRDMENLHKEFEKRNPTPTEKLSMRSKDGGPFNVGVDEYWRTKEAEGNYSREDDNNGVGDSKYQITQGDIDSVNNWNDIASSLDDNKFHMSLRDIMGY